MTRPWQRLAVGALGVGLALSGLAGCSDDDKGGNTQPTDAPTGVALNMDLPPDYPADQAPIIKGQINAVQMGEVEGHPRWQLMVLPKGDLEAAVKKATNLLHDAGWKGRAKGEKAHLTRADGEEAIVEVRDYNGDPNLYFSITLA